MLTSIRDNPNAPRAVPLVAAARWLRCVLLSLLVLLGQAPARAGTGTLDNGGCCQHGAAPAPLDCPCRAAPACPLCPDDHAHPTPIIPESAANDGMPSGPRRCCGCCARPTPAPVADRDAPRPRTAQPERALAPSPGFDALLARGNAAHSAILAPQTPSHWLTWGVAVHARLCRWTT